MGGQPTPYGEHGDEVLLELGHDWDGVISLKASGDVMQ